MRELLIFESINQRMQNSNFQIESFLNQTNSVNTSHTTYLSYPNLHTRPVITNYTKASQYKLFSQITKVFLFWLQQQVTIGFEARGQYKPTQCFQHIINIIWKLSKHLHTTCNHKFIKFNSHLEPTAAATPGDDPDQFKSIQASKHVL